MRNATDSNDGDGGVTRRTVLKSGAIGIGVLGFGPVTGRAVGTGRGRPTVVSGLGVSTVQGHDVLVDVFVRVGPSEPPAAAISRELEAQGARPFDAAALGTAGFTVTGLEIDSLPFVQYYNPTDEPAQVNGATALRATHSTWDGVSAADFAFEYGGTTDRCPSLVRECRGPQTLDGYNDVAWVALRPGVLGVSWYSIDSDEVDIALNTRYAWVDEPTDSTDDGDYDAQTVLLHENGHTLGLGHSTYPEAVMYSTYHGGDRDLYVDDEEGETYLYDETITGVVSGTVTDTSGDPIEGATVALSGTGLGSVTGADGTYSIGSVPDPVTYDVVAGMDGYGSQTRRERVDGNTSGIDFALEPAPGQGNGGGQCPPGNPNHRKC